jgi:hypothetical protein
MARPRNVDTPEGRLTAMREARARKRAPTCHPDRPQVGKTGLCHECYIGAGTTRSLTLQDAMKIAERHADPIVGKSIREAALALLVDRLPEYAAMHFEAAKMAALKGDAKPAEWALTTIKSHGNAAVVDLPKNTPTEGGIKIFVGVKLGGPDKELPASTTLDAHIVPTGESTG